MFIGKTMKTEHWAVLTCRSKGLRCRLCAKPISVGEKYAHNLGLGAVHLNKELCLKELGLKKN
jgi:hypothetical protein